MTIMNRLGAAIAVAAASLVAAAPGAAATLTLERDGDLWGGRGYDVARIKYPGAPSRVAAGQFHLTDASTREEILAWCIDLDEALMKAGQTTKYDIDVAALTGDALTDTQRLFDTAYAGMATADKTARAGFQVALWEIVSDNKRDLGGGRFELKGGKDVRLAAQGFLDGLEGTRTASWDLTFLTHDGRQDLVTATRSVAAIPLPAAGWMLGAGLVGLAALRGRRALRA